MGNAAIGNKEIIVDEGHKPLEQIFWAFIDIKLNASKIEKVGTGRLETVVGPYGLPDGLDRCGIFHDGIT